MENESKISFLSTAITDAQEIIRFIETKTGVVITILGAYFVFIFTNTENLIKYYAYYDTSILFSFIIFIICQILCIIIIVGIVKPASNPNQNINKKDGIEPKLSFYLTPNVYKGFYILKNNKNNKLRVGLKEYQEILGSSDDQEIINALTIELLKVSFIRNLKSDRFKSLLKVLLITTICFMVFYLLFNIETEKARLHIEVINKAHQRLTK